MRCPYMRKVITKHQSDGTRIKECFYMECYGKECMAYYKTMVGDSFVEHCKRMESIIRDD